MEDKKEYCQNIYQKYKELREKTKLEVKEIEPGGKIDPQYINPEDIKEKLRVRDELKSCLIYLSDETLEELFNDDDFMGKAMEILKDRRKFQK